MFNVIFHGIFVFFFAKYTFFNPDTGECWAEKTSKTPSDTSIEGHNNVSSNFTWWFSFGLLINVAMLIVGAIQLTVFCAFKTDKVKDPNKKNMYGQYVNNQGPKSCMQKISEYPANWVNGIALLVGTAWLIMGLVFRYREVGAVCSGDYVLKGSDDEGANPYAWKSGSFIHFYYIVIMWLLIAAGSCCCCVCLITSVMASNS